MEIRNIEKYFLYCLVIITLNSCQGDPVSNKIFILLYIIPLGIIAYFIGHIISLIVNLGNEEEVSTIRKIVIGGLALLLIYNIFVMCS